jgi:enoyl-CoA hydratase
VNAFDLPFAREIGERLREALACGPSSLVITGDGKCFGAGVDTKAVREYGPAERAEMVSTINALLSSIYALPIPVVAAVNGHALGGALVVALACDLRIGVAGPAKLGLPEVAAGVPFPAVPMRIVQAELVPAVARMLCLANVVLSPREALERGVLDELCDGPAALVPRAEQAARELAALPSYAVVKHQLRAPAIADLERIVAERSDPMLREWVAPQQRSAR